MLTGYDSRSTPMLLRGSAGATAASRGDFIDTEHGLTRDCTTRLTLPGLPG